MHRRSFVTAALTLLLTLTALGPAGAAVDFRGPFLDKAGTPLPFSDDDRVVNFLETAPIVATKKLGKGSTGVLKVTLEQDGVRLHGVFRSVHEVYGKQRSTRPDRFAQRDSHLNEVAAYRVDRVLGLNRVPPTVRRRVNGRDGSIQLWVENARSETERIEAGEVPADPTSLLYQKHVLRVFDALIYNFDRNTGNLLLDNGGKLWFIDHTRSFKRRPGLPDPGRLVVCERRVWQRLQAIDAEILRKRLAPYLDTVQINAVVKRHRALVDHFEQRIAQGGEDRVLFDLV